jgi:hypothetical protein
MKLGTWQDFKDGFKVDHNDGLEVRVYKVPGGWKASLYRDGRVLETKFNRCITRYAAEAWGKRKLARWRRAAKSTKQSGRVIR